MLRVLVATTCTPDDRKTLGVARALSRAGALVTVGGDRHQGRAFFSKHVEARIEYPHPGADPDGFVEALQQCLKESPHDVVIPTSDYTTLALSRFEERLSEYSRILAPGMESATLVRDKLELLSLAERIGLEVPATRCPAQDDDLGPIVRDLGVPVVVKPRRGMGGIGVRLAKTPEALGRCLENRFAVADEVFDLSSLLVQEWVPGEVHDVCALFNRGEPRATLTQRRLAMYPESGGPGIFNETTDEPELKERAILLLRELGWHGPAQVEFKIDRRDDSVKLIEVNGRFWGTLDLATAAGIDFPGMAAKMAIHGDIESVTDYRVGLQFRWPVPYALLHALESRRSWSSLWRFLRPSHEIRSDLWLTDPLPWLAESAFAVQRMAHRSVQRWRPQSSDDGSDPQVLHDLSHLRSMLRSPSREPRVRDPSDS
ncbi:MAG: ATP-grasp domain-containing protein [Thermoanaerobaculia bacterium]